MKILDAETVVVGGGTAGCVVAARLAERGRQVLLLEAGGPYSHYLLGPPLPSQRFRGLFSWNYHSVEQASLDNRQIYFPLGRVLGGCSAINAMIYSPGIPSDYDGWAKLGNSGWSYSDVAPLFERAVGTGAESPGTYCLSRPRFRSDFSEAFVAAAAELGLDFDFFDVSQSEGERTSTARAYIPLGLSTGRLKVMTGARASRIIFEGTRAIGVEFLHRKRKRQAMAGREVVLCGGAVNSPQLLMLSGVGPAEHLRAVGLDVIVDLPGVGSNLQDHVRVPVLYEILAPRPGDVHRWLPAAADYLFRRRGVFTSNCCEAGGFVRSSEDRPEPDLQWITHFKHSLRPDVVDLEFCLMKPGSRGQIRLRSGSPLEAPFIDPRYLSRDCDLKPMLAGLALSRALARTAPLRRLPLGKEVWPGADVTREADLVRYFRRTLETCYHLAGSCKMGADEMAVVDEGLRVRGAESLWIADTSIMPELVHGNTQAPALMIGEKAADLISAADRPARSATPSAAGS